MVTVVFCNLRITCDGSQHVVCVQLRQLSGTNKHNILIYILHNESI